MIGQNGKPIGSEIIGRLFTKPQYFQGGPSAAGKNGYDPTATGGTNLGPTSKKLIDATKATIAAHIRGRTFRILGEPRVNMLEVNLALDDAKTSNN